MSRRSLPAKRGGRKREVNVREVMNGVMYVLSTGCQWRAIPKDLPPRSTVFAYLDLWSYDGTLERIHHELYVRCREQAEREASPTAAIIDSQSVKSAEKGGQREGEQERKKGRKEEKGTEKERTEGREWGEKAATAAIKDAIQEASLTRCSAQRRNVKRSIRSRVEVCQTLDVRGVVRWNEGKKEA